MSTILLNLNNFLFETEVELDDKFIDIYEARVSDLQNHMLPGPRIGKMPPPNPRDFSSKYAGTANRLGDDSYDTALISGTKGAGNAAKTVARGGAEPSLDKMFNPHGNLPHSPSNVGPHSPFFRGSADLHDARFPTSGFKPGLVHRPGINHAPPVDNMDPMNPVEWAGSKMVGGANKTVDFIGQNSGLVASGAAAVFGAGLLAKYKNSILRGNYLVNHYSKLASQARTPAEKQAISQKLNWAKSKLANAQSKARVEHKNFIEKSQRMKSYINELNKAGRKQEAAKLQEKLAKRQQFLSKIGATI